MRTAFFTFPDTIHRVQTLTRFRLPPRSIFTVWRLGSQRRFVLRLEWLTRFPVAGAFPHTVHILLILPLSFSL